MKSSLKKYLCLLMIALMLLTAASCGTDANDKASSTPSETVEKNGDIVILFTSDVHCGVDQGFGYAGLQQVREYLEAQGNDVILVDDGDSIQGETIGTVSNGEIPVDLMNQAGYEIAIPGNHEFDYGMDNFLSLVERAEYPYISCNLNYKGELVFEPYVIRELAGKKVAFVGVTTPETLRSSTPDNFKDENGEFVYGFFQDETGEGLYNAVQTAVDAARAEGAEYVVCMGHLGDEAACAPWTYGDVIVNTDGIDVLLDGHSHDKDHAVVKNKNGKEVLRAACGTKLASIGWCRITADGEISTGLYNWNNDAAAPEMLGIDNEMSHAVQDANEELNSILGEVVAKSSVELTINDPVEVLDDGSPVRMVRRAETNLGDFCADAFRDQSGADIGVINGGAARVSISAGDITYNDILSVYPFGNYMCVIEVTGQQILDALEWGASAIPGETGGFLQVSGLTYEIHSYIESPCQSDENGMFTGIQGERRVRNVMVGDDPIDPQKTYTLAGADYLLLSNGDGHTAFDGAPLLQDSVKIDSQVLIDYITESLEGVVGEEYDDPYGEGRIVIISEEP